MASIEKAEKTFRKKIEERNKDARECASKDFQKLFADLEEGKADKFRTYKDGRILIETSIKGSYGKTEEWKKTYKRELKALLEEKGVQVTNIYFLENYFEKVYIVCII